MADLVTVFHPLGWPVEVSPARAEVFRSRGYTDDDPRVVEDPAEVEDPVEDAAELKGEALDEALKEAGLPLTGKAEEKRARLAEHLAAQSDQDTPDTSEQ